MFFTFGAPLLLPLAVATTLGFTTPIFAVILSALLLRERVGPVRWLAVALGFAGVVIIAQPGHTVIPALGAFVGLGAGFMVALISIQVRDLGRTEESLSIVFWFAVISAPILALGLPFFASAHSSWQWFLLVSGGVLGLIGQLLLTASLRYGQVASVIVMDYSALVWSTIYGWAIWDELPPAATWLGAPVIIAAGAVIAWREHLHHRRLPPAAVNSAE
jgi:drug/metabolite transporter (DMT)-like permease